MGDPDSVADREEASMIFVKVPPPCVVAPCVSCTFARFVQADSVVLVLKTRKNRAQGSRLVRKCWCAASRTTCPVHVLGRFFLDEGVGSRPFSNITPDAARSTLRAMLRNMGVAEADAFCTKDFRRGHALDLQLSGVFVRSYAFGIWLILCAS